MTDLLSQLQTATEGSAELECRMWCEANGKIFIRAYEMDHLRPSWVQCMYRDKPRGRKQVTREGQVLRWTRDLQDAVSLVPEGVLWTIRQFATDAQADLFVDDFNGDEDLREDAATPCLALCIAIIKAHESKAEAA